MEDFKDCETVKEIWDFLEDIFEQSLRNMPQLSAEVQTCSKEDTSGIEYEETEGPTESWRLTLEANMLKLSQPTSSH